MKADISTLHKQDILILQRHYWRYSGPTVQALAPYITALSGQISLPVVHHPATAQLLAGQTACSPWAWRRVQDRCSSEGPLSGGDLQHSSRTLGLSAFWGFYFGLSPTHT